MLKIYEGVVKSKALPLGWAALELQRFPFSWPGGGWYRGQKVNLFFLRIRGGIPKGDLQGSPI